MSVVITVGDQQPTIQAAIDAMDQETPPLSPTNRGTIIVPPGLYKQQISDYVSHLDIIAQEPGTAIIERTGTGSGGTYRIGVESNDDVPSEPVWDKVVSGLRIIRNNAGTMPEGALYVGWPEGSTPEGNWDSIIIRDCIIEGARDGVHIAGEMPGPSPPGLVTIQNCIIRCLHDALAARGDFRLISKSNLIHVDTHSIDPYLTVIEPGKATGFHINRKFEENRNSFFKSSHDTIFMIGGGSVAVASSPEAHMAGYLFYDEKPQNGDVTRIPRTEIVSPKIHIEWNHDGAPANPIAGISVWSSRMEVPKNMLTIAGGSIRVRQISTHQNAPDEVYGVRVDAEGANEETDNIVRVLGTSIKIENAKQNGDEYSLATDGLHDKIEADVYSDEDISEGAGAITQAEHQPQ